MSQGFGIEVPREHSDEPHRTPARYLVLIDAAGAATALLFLADFEQVGEFDAGSEEVAQMSAGLVPVRGATGSAWERALDGHSAEERAAALVYTLEI
jgi:hypothetical protein